MRRQLLGLLPALWLALCCVVASEEAPVEWQKLETKPLPLTDPRQVLSPGLFDSAIQNIVALPKDAAADLKLPHEGKDASGKDYPAITLRLQGDVIWVDLNGDGKAGKDEIRQMRPEGSAEPPFACQLHYADGSSGPYSFRLKTVIEREKYALIRATARTATFQNHRIVLLDDNGNGKYNDEKDALLIDDGPVSFLGRYALIGDQLFELLVHVAGGAIEIRPAPKMDLGVVDLFARHEISQKSESLRIHCVVITGENGSFAFDEKHRKLKIPAGAYDFSFGLFERAKELVCLRKGEKTSFNVGGSEIASPKWGGDVTARYDVGSDGQEITVEPPKFIGQGSEEYYPENFRVVPISVTLSQVFIDRMRVEHVQPFSQKKFSVLPDGSIKPLVCKPMRHANDEYEIGIEYNSGIMGKVVGKQRLQFVYTRKEK
jgi:hypothetical protein